MKLSAVLFDFGNVLSGPPDPAARKQMASILAIDDRRFEIAYWKFRDAYDRGQLTGISYWQAVASDLGQSMRDRQLTELITADNRCWTVPNQLVIDWAKQVKVAGFRVGLLSNIGDAMEAGVLESCPWLHAFDHLTFSHRLGIAKPDAAIYAHAAAGLGVTAPEVLFIDDREENIAGAVDAGMSALHYIDRALFIAAIESLSAHTGLPLASF